MFSLAYRDVQQIVGSILFSGFLRVLTVGFTQMLQHWDVTSAFVEVLAVTDGEPEELSSFFPYCRQTKEHASERGAQSVRVATTTATATSALPAAAPPAARRASARCTGRSRAPNGIGLGEEGREQRGREGGGGVTCGGGGRWRRERRLFGRTCDRRFCGSVVHFCLSLSLFLSPFSPL